MELNDLLKKDNLSSAELQKLLKAREKGKIEFKLIDIREKFEYDEAHIVGCDKLLPTTQFQQWADELLNSDENIIIYCRTGNRTGQVQTILKQHGKAIPHLRDGIVAYRGEIE